MFFETEEEARKVLKTAPRAAHYRKTDKVWCIREKRYWYYAYAYIGASRLFEYTKDGWREVGK